MITPLVNLSWPVESLDESRIDADVIGTLAVQGV